MVSKRGLRSFSLEASSNSKEMVLMADEKKGFIENLLFGGIKRGDNAPAQPPSGSYIGPDNRRVYENQEMQKVYDKRTAELEAGRTPEALTTEKIEFDYKKRQEQQESFLKAQEREAELAKKRAEIKGIESQTAKRYAEIQGAYDKKYQYIDNKQKEKDLHAVKFGSKTGSFGKEPIYIVGGATPDLRSKYTPSTATGVARSLENSRVGLARLHETVLSRPTVSYTGSRPQQYIPKQATPGYTGRKVQNYVPMQSKPGLGVTSSGGVTIRPYNPTPPAVLSLTPNSGHRGPGPSPSGGVMIRPYNTVPQSVRSLQPGYSRGGITIPQSVQRLSPGAGTNIMQKLGVNRGNASSVLYRLTPKKKR